MKWLFIISSIYLVTSAFDCPSSKWFRFGHKCYLADKTQWLTFEQNADFCKSRNATTVSIQSPEENAFITTKLESDKRYWLGIRRNDKDGDTYEWLDGSLYHFSNWTTRSKEDCAGAVIYNGKWYEEKGRCNYTSATFCQIDFDPVLYKLQSRTYQEKQRLNQEITATNIRLNESIAKLEESVNALVTKDHQVNSSLAESKLLMKLINYTMAANEIENRNANKALAEKLTRGLTLDWIFRLLFITVFCILILSIFKIMKKLQWIRNEMKPSNNVLFVNNATHDNIYDRCS